MKLKKKKAGEKEKIIIGEEKILVTGVKCVFAE